LANLRERVMAAIQRGRIDELESLLREEKPALRCLVSLSYHPDPTVRTMAARGIGLASRHHPTRVAETLRRLIWAMNEESGTNATAAPDVFRAVAEERPELLLPLLGDLMRLSADPTLHDALVEISRTVAKSDPVGAAHSVAAALRCGCDAGDRNART
jgi:hypothetical protein